MSTTATIESWLALQCQMIPRASRGVVEWQPATAGAPATTVSWPAQAVVSAALVEACRRAAGRAETVFCDRTGETGPVVAAPLVSQGRLLGVIAVEVEELERAQRAAVARLLDWGSAWFELVVHGPPAVLAGRLSAVVGTVAAGLAHDSLEGAGTAIASRMAEALHCERVSVGLVRGHRAHLLATSHGPVLETRTGLARDLEAVMDEAIDERRALVHPPLAADDARAGSPCEKLARRHDDVSVCAVPLASGIEPVGAVVLERTAGAAFDQRDLELAVASAELLGPLLELRRRGERSVLATLLEDCAPRRLLASKRSGRRLALLVALAVVGFACIANGEHRITAEATLEGAVQRVVASPIAGFVKTAHQRAGDVVEAGALLATIDDKDLRLERRKWVMERAEARQQHRRAIGGLDRAEARIVAARVGQAQARIALLDEQLARTRIVAPFAGMLVSGDLSRAVGAPVERGQILFELAPLDAYRVALEVAEADVAAIERGQSGHLTLTARPDERLEFVVERIVGRAEPGDGTSRFRVEGQLVGDAERLRPGMKGIGKVNAGERRLGWVWTHGMVARARLWLWSRLP